MNPSLISIPTQSQAASHTKLSQDKPLMQSLWLMLRSFFVLAGLTLSFNTQAVAQSVDFADLVEQVAPGVVRVDVVQKISGAQNQQIPEVFKRFFGDQLPTPEDRLQSGSGSAFFISSDGYLITNHHVVEDADSITVTLSDRREIDAKLIGSDKRTDIALLKIEGSGYPALKLGNSDALRVGQLVLAIGSPFGFDYSASSGIVSATSRNISSEQSVPFIQTDVALNPGNSGGPLFNANGEVVGVNSRIFSGTGGYMGLSFSIPINLANGIVAQLKDSGSVSRAYLGVYPQDIDRNLAQVYGLPRPQGALITRLAEGEAAELAGIKVGDIILSLNDTAIDRAADLVNVVGRSKPGDRFIATVRRDNKNLSISGKLGKLESEEVKDEQTSSSNLTATDKLGMTLRSLTPDEKEYLEVSGVVITQVTPTGLAARSGLLRGDVITSLAGVKTPDQSALNQALAKIKKSPVVEVRLVRQGRPFILGLRVE